MNTFSAGMAGMVQAAASGQFAVDQGTGQQLMMSLSQMLDDVDKVLRKAKELDRNVNLGTLPEAVAVSQLDRQVAAGDPQSLYEVLQQFKTSLEQAYEAVRQGMANYEQVETQIAEDYNRGLQERNNRRPPTGGTVYV
jgi:flagellar hook-basal body complex protein FliE